MTDLRVVGWNVRQGGGSGCPAIASALVDLGADVAVISEHRPTGSGQLESCLAYQGFHHLLGGADPTGGHTGLLVASRQPIEAGTITFDSPTDGHRFRHVMAGRWHIACCYIPGSERGSSRKEEFWQFLLDTAEPVMRTVPTLLIGDLNTGLHYRDEPGATLDCSDAMVELERRGWTDAWVQRNREKRPPASWWSPGHKTPFRLDHALLSPVASRARAVDYPTHLNGDRPLCGKGALSDHAPLVVTLRV